MPKPRIIVVAEPRDSERAAWWASEIPGFWPRGSGGVSCDCLRPTELASELTSSEGTKGARRTTAVLLLAPAGERALLLQLIDRLLGSRTPALVLAEDPPTLRIELEPHGMVVEAASSDRKLVARILHTLTTRQAAIDVLASELRVARASQGGLSGEISRLHDELQLAGTVQRRFLPKRLPEIDGYEFGVLFRPCGYVSGDIYDVVRLDERHIAFMLADAVGHGVPAALLTLVLGRALRQVEPHGSERALLHSPSRTLARLNEELCIENEAGDRFATAVCGVIDTEAHRVTLASAGHPPAIVVESDRAASAVPDGHGPLLGVFAEADFPETTLSLRHGETLVLFTDGFETAFPACEQEAKRATATDAYIGQFARAFGRTGPGAGPVQDSLERLAIELEAQAGSLHQRDDLTAVALRRLAVPDVRPVSAGIAGRAAA